MLWEKWWWHRAATNLQLVKYAISAKHNKVKHSRRALPVYVIKIAELENRCDEAGVE